MALRAIMSIQASDPMGDSEYSDMWHYRQFWVFRLMALLAIPSIQARGPIGKSEY